MKKIISWHRTKLVVIVPNVPSVVLVGVVLTIFLEAFPEILAVHKTETLYPKKFLGIMTFPTWNQRVVTSEQYKACLFLSRGYGPLKLRALGIDVVNNKIRNFDEFVFSFQDPDVRYVIISSLNGETVGHVFLDENHVIILQYGDNCWW